MKMKKTKIKMNLHLAIGGDRPCHILMQIKLALSMVDGFCEIDWKGNDIMDWRKKVNEMIHSFHETHRSFSTFIFCAVLWDSPVIGADIFKGTRIMLDKYHHLRHINFFRGCADWIYMCVVNEESLLESDSWIPLSINIEKAFLMGVKAGEESKTLHILQSLFTQLCVHNGEYSEEDLLSYGRADPHAFEDENESNLEEHNSDVYQYDDFAVYDDDVTEF